MAITVHLPKRIVAMTYTGEENAAVLAAYLVMSSMWFVCEPLPDDLYEFVVKTEALQQLEQLAEIARKHGMNITDLETLNETIENEKSRVIPIKS